MGQSKQGMGSGMMQGGMGSGMMQAGNGSCVAASYRSRTNLISTRLERTRKT